MKKRLLPALACLMAVSFLSACSTTPNCLEPQPYMQAEQMSPLKAPAGLAVPRQDSDMTIPKTADGPIETRNDTKQTNKRNTIANCLIAPPPMSGNNA